MAKVPGPALALAGLAALFLLTRKGDGGSLGAKDVPEGTKVPDDSPGDKPGLPSGGGTKVPGGTGAGGGSWQPHETGPNKVWISPDCQTVVEGDTYYDQVVVPRVLEAIDNVDELTFRPVIPDGMDVSEGFLEGPFVDPYTYLGAALNLKDVFDDGTVENSTEPHMETPPHSCALLFPGFHIHSTYNSLLTPADTERLEQDMAEYANAYPELASWLMSLEERLAADNRVDNGHMMWVFSSEG